MVVIVYFSVLHKVQFLLVHKCQQKLIILFSTLFVGIVLPMVVIVILYSCIRFNSCWFMNVNKCSSFIFNFVVGIIPQWFMQLIHVGLIQI